MLKVGCVRLTFTKYVNVLHYLNHSLTLTISLFISKKNIPKVRALVPGVCSRSADNQRVTVETRWIMTGNIVIQRTDNSYSLDETRKALTKDCLGSSTNLVMDLMLGMNTTLAQIIRVRSFVNLCTVVKTLHAEPKTRSEVSKVRTTPYTDTSITFLRIWFKINTSNECVS